ncbi:sensor histidine kinase [Sphingomonas panacisoli]|uniref:sensor histidine kinase n=1 Tax=Sphingomonas panacisoli TaxID=1813879 RepID=UPI0016462940|nr:histidine kinase [Sphingomonas panacisoli]
MGQFVLLTVERVAVLGEFQPAMFLPRLIVTGAAILISLGLAAIVFRLPQRSLGAQGFIGLGCAFAATLLHAAANLATFLSLLPANGHGDVTIAAYAPPMMQWFWSYFGLIALLIAIKYALRVEESERRIASLERSELQAQMAALRYQLNPHFIFNAMNSIITLIGENRNADAEAMVENLSDFFRRTLELAPQEAVSIAEELALQKLYLDIERARFSDRLIVETHIAPDVGDALVPVLITQPLVENAVRHSVAMSSQPIQLCTSVTRSADRVSIEIRNTLTSRKGRQGPGVGLANIAARLAARYGSAASLEYGPVDGDYVATINFPFECRAC